MQIRIVTVGKLKGGFSYLQEGIDDYLKRMKPYADIAVVEVPDEAITPSRTAEQVMEREGERLLRQMEKAAYTIALSERGERLDSEKFSRALFARIGHGANQPNGGMSANPSGPIILIVGGALGLSRAVLDRADWTVSLSPMTFPHPLARLVLVEQLYRAFRIHRGEPYHK